MAASQIHTAGITVTTGLCLFLSVLSVRCKAEREALIDGAEADFVQAVTVKHQTAPQPAEKSHCFSSSPKRIIPVHF